MLLLRSVREGLRQCAAVLPFPVSYQPLTRPGSGGLRWRSLQHHTLHTYRLPRVTATITRWHGERSSENFPSKKLVNKGKRKSSRPTSSRSLGLPTGSATRRTTAVALSQAFRIWCWSIRSRSSVPRRTQEHVRQSKCCAGPVAQGAGDPWCRRAALEAERPGRDRGGVV